MHAEGRTEHQDRSLGERVEAKLAEVRASLQKLPEAWGVVNTPQGQRVLDCACLASVMSERLQDIFDEGAEELGLSHPKAMDATDWCHSLDQILLSIYDELGMPPMVSLS